MSDLGAAGDAAYGALWFVLIVVGFVLWIAYDRLRHPHSRCSCDGGRVYSAVSGRWRTCPMCKGTGVRSRK